MKEANTQGRGFTWCIESMENSLQGRRRGSPAAVSGRSTHARSFLPGEQFPGFIRRQHPADALQRPAFPNALADQLSH